MNVKSTIQWATPYSLGLLLAVAVAALAGFVLLRWASGRPIAPARRPGLLVLRLAILAILGLIIINPVRVDETPGTVERPETVLPARYVAEHGDRQELDPMGAGRADDPRRRPCPGPPRRGPGQPVPVREPAGRRGRGVRAADGRRAGPPEYARRLARRGAPAPGEPPPAPTDSDTLLGASLEGLTNRFGQAPPRPWSSSPTAAPRHREGRRDRAAPTAG